MYAFGILLFGGLITGKTADFLRQLAKELHSAGALFLTALVGVGYAYLFNFSVFAAWKVPVRADWIGTLATGLAMGALAYVWDAVIGMLSSYHRSGGVSDSEARMRAA